jgi:hypothetical protein
MAGVLLPLWRARHRIAEAQQVDQLVTDGHGRTSGSASAAPARTLRWPR